MTDLNLSENKNKHKGIYDGLTGAYTRGMLDERLIQELDWAMRCQLPLSLCFIDMDYFKSINDAYGHKRGDEVLVSFAKRIEGIMRKSDMLFRYGGDEFVLMLPNTFKEEGLVLLRKIHEKFKSEPISGDPPLTLSLSIGVASYPEDALSVEALLKLADSRCFEAKRNGRGCIVSDTQTTNICSNFDNGNLLVEREYILDEMENFMCNLFRAEQGIFGILGTSGSGGTVLLERAVELGKKKDFFTIPFLGREDLKSNAYGVLKNCKELKVEDPCFTMDYMENEIISQIKDSNKKGIVFIIDNLKFIDYCTINFLRYLVINNKIKAIGIIYYNNKNDFKSFENLKVQLNKVIDINPLTFEGTYRLLKDTIKIDPPEEFASWIYKKTKGLPKHFFEGLSYLSEQGFIQVGSQNEIIIDPEYETVYLDKRLGINNDIIPNNLPEQTSEFVGRENEIFELNKLLDKNRLVTILGTGGIGKTKLALKVASDRLIDYKDGVYYISLASLNRPDMIISAISSELNIKETPGQVISDSVKEYLHERHCLIILDNFEQVINGAPVIGELLAAAPLLSILVTSREAMRISGEYIYNIPFMDISKKQNVHSLSEIILQPPLVLFYTRAIAVNPDFIITDKNASLILELCQGLDGIPLAIELAASNIKDLSIEEMLENMGERLKWGGREISVILKRHQTMKHVIEWSYNMLNEAEKKFFNRLGIFAGSFNKKGLEKILSHDINDIDINEGIRVLSNKCLIRINYNNNKNEEIYIDMIETIREYALSNLKNSQDYEKYINYHAEYYLNLIEEANEKLDGHLMSEWLNRIQRAYPNIRLAIEWAQKSGNTEMELKLVAAMGLFWETRGFWSEGKRILEEIYFKYNGKYQGAVFTKIYQWYGKMLILLGENKNAKDIFDEGLEVCRKYGDYLTEASILHSISYIYGLDGKVEEQQLMLADSLKLYRIINHKVGMSMVLSDLGLKAFYVGDYDRAYEYVNESLQLSNETGNKRCLSWALLRMGYVKRSKGNYMEASNFFERALEIHEEIDDKLGITESLISLAEIARSQGEYDLALQYYNKNLNICENIGYKELRARIMNDIGEIYRYKGDYELAKDLYEKSLLIIEEIGHKSNIIWVYRNLAEIRMINGDFSGGKDYYIKSLEYQIKTWQRSLVHLTLVLGGIIEAETEMGNYEKAAKLMGCAQFLAEKVRSIISKNDIAEFDRRCLYIETKMSEEDFKKSYNEGYGMDVESILLYAVK